MKELTKALIVAVMLVLPAQSAFATNQVGYNYLEVPANTDVLLTVPFNTNPAGEFVVTNVTGSGVEVADTLNAGEFNDTHYVRFVTGNGEGLWSTIDENGTGDFVLGNTAVLPYINTGDTFRVYRHYTLRTLFPKGMLNVSYSLLTVVAPYINDLDNMQQNKSSEAPSTYVAAGGGKWIGGAGDNTILAPETQFVLRTPANLVNPLKIFFAGDLADYDVSMLIAPNGDLNVGTGYGLPVLLQGSGLEGNLRVVGFYDNAATGVNKSATAALYSAAQQKWVGVPADKKINPSEGILFRLPVSEAGTKVTINNPIQN